MSKIHDSVPIDADTRQGVTALTSDGSIKDRPLEDGPFDIFYVSPEQRAEYGVKDNETLRWIRDPEQWRHIEKLDRAEQIKAPVHRGGMSGRVVMTKDFDKVYIGGGASGDLILAAIPNEVIEQQQREVDQSRVMFEQGMTQTEEGLSTDQEFMERRPEVIKQRMRAEHEFHVRTGLIGPTSNMTLQQADAHMRRMGIDVEAKQEMLRNGGYHAPMDPANAQASFAAIMSGVKELGRTSAKPSMGKQVAMGDSGFRRNPNSPLAQAQRRGAQGG